jgi:putative membrane protein
MKNIFNFLIAAFLISATACNNNSATSSNSTEAAVDSNKKELEAKDSTQMEDDVKFAVTAANGGLLEVQLGKLAKTKATSPQVLEFASMMVDDHSAANKELMDLAGKKVITLPAILDNKTQKEYNDFEKMGKKDFDKAYMDYMVKDHKEDIDEFKKEAENGKDAELKAFANKTIPVLQHHLEMAEKANSALKK